jgi:hypothetical protein
MNRVRLFFLLIMFAACAALLLTACDSPPAQPRALDSLATQAADQGGPTAEAALLAAQQTRIAAEARATAIAVDGLAAAATSQAAGATAQAAALEATRLAEATVQAVRATRDAEAAALEATRTTLALAATAQAANATATRAALGAQIEARQTLEAVQLASQRIAATAEAEQRRAQWDAQIEPITQTATVGVFGMAALIALALLTYAGVKWIRTEDLRRRVVTGVDGDMVLLDRPRRGTAVVMPGRGFGPVTDVHSGPADEEVSLAYHDAANARYNAVKAVAAAASGGRETARGLPGLVNLLSAPADGTTQTVEVIMLGGEDDPEQLPPGVNRTLLEAAERDWLSVER